MQKQIQKSLQEFVSKVKTLNKQMQFPACKHSRTASLAVGVGRESDAATLVDIDRFLLENFGSLYRKENQEEEEGGGEQSGGNEEKTSTYLADLTEFSSLEGLCASDRFFVDFGSSSPRIVDEASSSGGFAANEFHSASDGEDQEESESADDFIVLLRQSRSPYEDFRRSMKAMVEARVSIEGNIDWKYLEELLGCYLNLNKKRSHKYIVQAFVDLVAILRENLRQIPASIPTRNGGISRS